MRIAKNENILERILPPTERIYFWCMKKKGPGSKIDKNQRVAIDICIKDKCHYLELENNSEPRCHCPTSMQYIGAFKGNWRKRREEEKEQSEEEGND